VGQLDVSWVALAEMGLGITTDEVLWSYLFDATWASVDNTPTGAAKRIRWVIQHQGIPVNWHYQQDGMAGLSYEKPMSPLCGTEKTGETI
jgi:hypothetical protein